MQLIPTQTLAAIDAHEEAQAETPHRSHLGASIIGEECERKLWYGYRWAGHETFSGQKLRLFERGNLEEARFIQYLRNVGVTVWEAGSQHESKFDMRISAHYGHFGGTPDGVGRGLVELENLDTPFLLEFKTHGDKSFQKLKSDGLLNSKWLHFIQMQTYMTKLNLEFGLYCAVNKNDDELYFQIVANDLKAGPAALEKARRVIFSGGIPDRIATTPTDWRCKFCHFRSLCFQAVDAEPEVNCRTCNCGTPAKDADDGEPGRWYCLHHCHELDDDMQRAGCDAWNVHVGFIQ